MKKLFILFVLFAAIFADCKKDEDHSDDINAEYVIPVNGRFQLLFTSNPSTGISWHWMNRLTTSVVDTVAYSFIYDTPGRMGSPGTEYWTFKGIKTGVDTLEFQLRRSMLSGVANDTTTVVVRVK
jgi:predicted secreted protein